MFEYYDNALCVQANWLDQIGIISQNALKVMASRGKVKKARAARGLGNYALYVYESLPERFRTTIEHDLGIKPYEEASTINLVSYLKTDESAAAYFSNYELEDGRYLSEASLDAVEEYTANACIFNAIQKVMLKVLAANPKINKADLWDKISKAVQSISADLRKRYPFDLPNNPRALRAKYEACILQKPNSRYSRTGLEGLIHDNYCNANSMKISQDVGEWLIAYYSLPNKPTIPELLKVYEFSRSSNGWPRLSESGVFNFLSKPENERIWTLARDGKDAYTNKFGHSIKRNRETLFPNAHWAIDGTKLDAIHYRAEGNKMAAEMQIDVVVDVYSERIIGWSFSETETHIDHFKAVKMAVNTAGAKPYLFTYDAQSGHRSKKMQELYSKIVAKGGTHYHHKVGRKSNPIEQIFNRFQQQVIGKRWFSDKQSIKAKQSRSQVNPDFIKEFKSALPTKEELYKHFILMVQEWNEAKHPKFDKSRNAVYATKTDYYQELDALEQISMFWLNETKPKKYYPFGMPLTVAGEDYEYEVYDKDGNIDIDFRRKYVNSKLIVSYDPEMLNEFIALYELNANAEKVFVAYAKKKREHAQVPVLMGKDGEEKLRKDMMIRDLEYYRDWEQYQKIAERTGITRESLIDEQNAMIINNFELDAKMTAYGTKEEQLNTGRKSVFEKFNNK